MGRASRYAPEVRERAVAARVQRNVNRVLRLVAQAMKTGKLPPSLSAGIMDVRVGNETLLIEIAVPKAIRALDKKRRK